MAKETVLISGGAGYIGSHTAVELIAAGYDADVIVRIRPKIVRARKRLQFNGNPQSIIDELLFSMLEVKAKCRR